MNKVLALTIAAVCVGLIAGFAGVLAVRGTSGAAPTGGVAFHEEKWPFLLDEWGVGKAFGCVAANCGVKVDVYVRPKIGFCNCTTGVADDQELERVADTALVADDAPPTGPGHVVRIGWMKGLSRAYQASGANLISVAFNNQCDVVVAVASLGAGDPTAIEPAVIAFLGSEPMLQWTRHELGLAAAPANSATQ
jgi:hypothetical protein